MNSSVSRLGILLTILLGLGWASSSAFADGPWPNPFSWTAEKSCENVVVPLRERVFHWHTGGPCGSPAAVGTDQVLACAMSKAGRPGSIDDLQRLRRDPDFSEKLVFDLVAQDQMKELRCESDFLKTLRDNSKAQRELLRSLAPAVERIRELKLERQKAQAWGAASEDRSYAKSEMARIDKLINSVKSTIWNIQTPEIEAFIDYWSEPSRQVGATGKGFDAEIFANYGRTDSKHNLTDALQKIMEGTAEDYKAVAEAYQSGKYTCRYKTEAGKSGAIDKVLFEGAFKGQKPNSESSALSGLICPMEAKYGAGADLLSSYSSLATTTVALAATLATAGGASPLLAGSLAVADVTVSTIDLARSVIEKCGETAPKAFRGNFCENVAELKGQSADAQAQLVKLKSEGFSCVASTALGVVGIATGIKSARAAARGEHLATTARPRGAPAKAGESEFDALDPRHELTTNPTRAVDLKPASAYITEGSPQLVREVFPTTELSMLGIKLDKAIKNLKKGDVLKINGNFSATVLSVSPTGEVKLWIDRSEIIAIGDLGNKSKNGQILVLKGDKATVDAIQYPIKINVPGKPEHQLNILIPTTANNPSEIYQTVKHTIDQLPANYVNSIKKVRVSPGANIDDPHWQKVYKNFSESAATGGAGEVNFFVNVNQTQRKQMLNYMYHEFGHNVSDKIWKSPKPSPLWTKAKEADGISISNYGNQDIQEDFAESVMFYLAGGRNDPKFRDMFKNRVQMLDDIFNRADGAEYLAVLEARAKREIQLLRAGVTAGGAVFMVVGNNVITMQPTSNSRQTGQ